CGPCTARSPATASPGCSNAPCWRASSPGGGGSPEDPGPECPLCVISGPAAGMAGLRGALQFMYCVLGAGRSHHQRSLKGSSVSPSLFRGRKAKDDDSTEQGAPSAGAAPQKPASKSAASKPKASPSKASST